MGNLNRAWKYKVGDIVRFDGISGWVLFIRILECSYGSSYISYGGSYVVEIIGEINPYPSCGVYPRDRTYNWFLNDKSFRKSSEDEAMSWLI